MLSIGKASPVLTCYQRCPHAITAYAAQPNKSDDSRATIQDNPIIRANRQIFREQDYLATEQSKQRADWARSVRSATGRERQTLWRPELDPPAVLSQVTIVLISPRRPVTAGTVARACSAFEVLDMRIVAPRCSHLSRHALGSSKGAQYILHSTRTFDTISEATFDCDLTVAFTRWVKGQGLPFYDLTALMEHPLVRELVSAKASTSREALSNSSSKTASSSTSEGSNSIGEYRVCNGDRSSSSRISREGSKLLNGGSHSSSAASSQGVRIALVFGESLSLSHAVSISLSSLFQHRTVALSK